MFSCSRGGKERARESARASSSSSSRGASVVGADPTRLLQLSEGLRTINAQQALLEGRKDVCLDDGGHGHHRHHRPSSARVFSLELPVGDALDASPRRAPRPATASDASTSGARPSSAMAPSRRAEGSRRERPRGARVRFDERVTLHLFAYGIGASIPSDGGPALGLGAYVGDDAYELDAFEAFRGGSTAAQVDASRAAYEAKVAAQYLKRLEDPDYESDSDDDSEEEEADDDDPEEWPENWRFPRETFQDDGSIPSAERSELLRGVGHRRLSIDLNAFQLASIAQSRKLNARARAARLIIDGDDPDEVMAWLQDMEKIMSVEPYATHWRETARERAKARTQAA